MRRPFSGVMPGIFHGTVIANEQASVENLLGRSPVIFKGPT